MSSGRVLVRGCTFIGNSTNISVQRGGALRSAAESLDVIDCVFTLNSARQGGAVAVEGSGRARLRSSIFHGNTADDAGGAVHHGGSGLLSVESCLLSHNSAPRAGALNLVGSARTVVSAVTLVGNSAGSGSSLQLSDSSRAHVSNSILWGAPAGNGVVALLSGPNVALELAYSTLPHNPAPVKAVLGATLVLGPGILHQDPLLLPPSHPADEWQLSASSPCIDAGSNALLPQDLLDLDGDGLYGEPMPFDLAGAPRLVDATGAGPVVDQGAYERQR